MPDLGWWLEDFKESAFRLERLPRYNMPEEAEMLATFKRGEKVVLWYLSANRDEDVFPDGDRLEIDRANAREQLSFGTGIHFCLGAHLGRLQLRVLWEEVMKRFSRIEVTGSPARVRSIAA